MTPGATLMKQLCILLVMATAVSALTHLFGTPEQEDLHASFNAELERRDVIRSMADDWSGIITYGASYSALTPMSESEGLATNINFDPSDDYWGLPRTAGVESVSLFCGSCHSLAIVMQQSQTADGWRYLLDWMVEKQGMARLSAEDDAVIHAYLSREFASE